MKNKTQRQLEIRKIIKKGDISSQEELLVVLKNKGYELTQATLSRDLKVLHAIKTVHPVKGYVYSISESSSTKAASSQSRANYLADGFQSIQFSGNLAVIKTTPGYASSIAAVIDDAKPWEIIGTIAGDDTILIIQREGISKDNLVTALIAIMPKLKQKI